MGFLGYILPTSFCPFHAKMYNYVTKGLELDMRGPQLGTVMDSSKATLMSGPPLGTVMALCAGPSLGTVRDMSKLYSTHMQSTHGTWKSLLYTSVYTLGTSLLALVNIVQHCYVRDLRRVPLGTCQLLLNVKFNLSFYK